MQTDSLSFGDLPRRSASLLSTVAGAERKSSVARRLKRKRRRLKYREKTRKRDYLKKIRHSREITDYYLRKLLRRSGIQNPSIEQLESRRRSIELSRSRQSFRLFHAQHLLSGDFLQAVNAARREPGFLFVCAHCGCEFKCKSQFNQHGKRKFCSRKCAAVSFWKQHHENNNTRSNTANQPATDH